MKNRPTQEKIHLENDHSDIMNNVAQRRLDSAVIQINDTHRQCHLASMLPSSEISKNDTVRKPIDFRVYNEAAGYLAMLHFNERNPRVLRHLPQTLRDCNILLSMEMHDTRFSPMYASQHLLDILNNREATTTAYSSPATPIAIVGAARSAVSQTLSILAGVYELPQISASSTSAALDNKESSPYFARTVPTNSNDAKATILYLHYLGVTHLGVIFIQDEFGTAFHVALLEEASNRDITIFSTSFDDNESTDSIVTGIQELRKSGLRYFMGIFNPRTWKVVVREASRAGIMGTPEYSWLLSDASLELTQQGFKLNDTEADLAAAVDGVGVVLLKVEPNAGTAAFDKALSELENNTVFQEEFVKAHVDPVVFDGYEFPFPGPALYQYLNYDAVMALGIAACRAPQEFFTGPELYETLKMTEFEGVSGLVRFSNTTGTRDGQGVQYSIVNVRLAQNKSSEEFFKFNSTEPNQTSEEFFYFNSTTAVAVNVANDNPIRPIAPFVYAGGSTIRPDPLPELKVDLNLIPKGIRITGLTLGSLTMLCAALWLAWTIKYRKIDVVRVAQPVFLCQLCVGAFILASAVIPMSMQEPTSQHGLNIACMCTPWLLSVGFVTAFAALFSKAWRLNKLFQSGKSFRRVKVRARDVIYPFLILMVLNVTILAVWTAVAPLQRRRVSEQSFDRFGRSVESYGTCYGGGDDALQYFFAALILFVNVVAIVFLLYQSYQARNLPTEFNESLYVCVTTVSLLEALLLAGPLLLLVYDSPSADFMIKSILVTIAGLAILLPMFIPKYLQRNLSAMRKQSKECRTRRSSVARILTAGDRQLSSPVPASTDAVVIIGKSTITRSEDYYLQRSSTPEVRRQIATETGRHFIKESKPSPEGSSDSNGKREVAKSISISAFDALSLVEPDHGSTSPSSSAKEQPSSESPSNHSGVVVSEA